MLAELRGEMGIREQVRRLASQGRQAEAIALVEQAVREEDAEALFLSAAWHFGGLYGAYDFAAGHRLLEKAARLGFADAALLRANLLANGTGSPADFEGARAILSSLARSEPKAARQLQFLKKLREPNPRVQSISTSPSIRLFEKAFSVEECDYLVMKAAPDLKQSMVVGPSGRSIPDPVRRSHGMQFDASKEDLVVRSLNERIARLTGTRVEAAEYLHVLRYGVGDEFRPHIDAIPGLDNQREFTVLVYLNQQYEGGETRFPELDITVKGRRGDCLVFRNVTDDGKPDPRTIHAGLPVRKGVKWLASRWIHEQDYDPYRSPH